MAVCLRAYKFSQYILLLLFGALLLFTACDPDEVDSSGPSSPDSRFTGYWYYHVKHSSGDYTSVYYSKEFNSTNVYQDFLFFGKRNEKDSRYRFNREWKIENDQFCERLANSTNEYECEDFEFSAAGDQLKIYTTPDSGSKYSTTYTKYKNNSLPVVVANGSVKEHLDTMDKQPKSGYANSQDWAKVQELKAKLGQ